MDHLLKKLQQRTGQRVIDRIEAIPSNNQIIVIKTMSICDPLFNQGVFNTTIQQSLIDAHVQSALLLQCHDDHLDDHHYTLSNIQSFSNQKTIGPGDQIRIETERRSKKDDAIQFESRGYVDGHACSTICFTLRETNPNSSGTFIHPTASVHPSARLGHGVHIGPYCIVNNGVTIDDQTELKAHVFIDSGTVIGKNNAIQYGAVIGAQPQDVKYNGEMSFVHIGDNNHIREYVTINRSTGAGTSTVIGDNNMLLTNTHIGHNCVIGHNVTIANVVHVGGHVVIEDAATIGGLTGIHQFVRVGKGAMIGGYSRLIQDVPPFMLCDGNPAYVRNVNIVGCRRRGMSRDALNDLKQLYKCLYRSQLNTKQALDAFVPTHASDDLDHLMAFLQHDTSRGISKKSSADTE